MPPQQDLTSSPPLPSITTPATDPPTQPVTQPVGFLDFHGAALLASEMVF